MNIIETNIPEVKLIEPRVFHDDRGFFLETHQENRYRELGIEKTFLQDNVSRSTQGVLRGMHYQLQKPQAKLVFVTKGSVLDVAVDIRKGSPTFGQHVAVALNDQNHHQLYIPEGFAHGFCVLSETADFVYKCSDFYDPPSEQGIRFNDPDLNIAWPDLPKVMIDKDLAYPCLKDQVQLPEYVA